MVESGWVKKVTLLFLIKSHTKQDADKMFNLLKQGTNGEDILTTEELDAALTKKNKQYINLMRVEGKKWRNWTEGLHDYYQDPPSGLILVNHEFVFGNSVKPTKYKRKEYRDLDTAEEFGGQRTLSNFSAASGSSPHLVYLLK